MQSLPDIPATKKAVCQTHGSYLATNLHAGRIWTGCPACLEQMESRRQTEEQERRAQEAAERTDRRLATSGLQGRFLRTTFDTYQATTAAQRQALATCRSFAEDFDSAATTGGLWLIGPPGTGKTHLASAIVNHLIRVRQIPARVHAVHEVMALARARINGTRASAWDDDRTVDDFISTLGQIPLLVLDEIGVSRGSDWETEQLFAIVDARYKRSLPTCICSNLTPAQLKTELGHRVYDRLREGAKQVTCSWQSHRN